MGDTSAGGPNVLEQAFEMALWQEFRRAHHIARTACRSLPHHPMMPSELACMWVTDDWLAAGRSSGRMSLPRGAGRTAGKASGGAVCDLPGSDLAMIEGREGHRCTSGARRQWLQRKPFAQVETYNHSLFRQSFMLYELTTNMPEHRLVRFMSAFADSHRVTQNLQPLKD